jgi:hypothetical protein
MLRPILLPGLLASGVGSLVFIGLDAWTRRGTFSLTIPDLPSFARPDLAQFAWAVVIGIAAAGLVAVVRRIGVTLRAPVERRILVTAPLDWPTPDLSQPSAVAPRSRPSTSVRPSGSSCRTCRVSRWSRSSPWGGRPHAQPCCNSPSRRFCCPPCCWALMADRDAAGHRGRDGVLCRVGTLGARPGSTGGPGGHPSDGPGHGWTGTTPPADTG